VHPGWFSVSTNNKDTKIINKTFVRIVNLGDLKIEAGKVSYVKIIKTNIQRFNQYDFAQKFIKNGMGIEKWQIRRKKDAWVFEAYWEKLNRLLRIYVVDKKDYISISTAVFRRGFIDIIARETETIQARLHEVNTKRYPWVDKLISISKLIIKDAYAITPCPNASACPVGDTGCVMASMSCFSGTDVNPVTIEPSSHSSVPSRGRWSLTPEGRRTIQENRDWVNDQLKNENLFMKGAALGAGLAAGAVAINAAVYVVSESASGLYSLIHEAITHDKEKKEILKNFQIARENYEKLMEKITALEKGIDGFFVMHKLSTSMGLSRESILAQLKPLIFLKEAEFEVSKKQLIEALAEEASCTNVATCQPYIKSKKLSEQTAALDTYVKNLKNIWDHFNDSGKNPCNELVNIVDKIYEAEGALQDARLSIINAEHFWLESFEDSLDDTHDVSENIRATSIETHRAKLQTIKKLRDRALEQLDDQVHAKAEICFENNWAPIFASSVKKYPHIEEFGQNSPVFDNIRKKLRKLCADSIKSENNWYNTRTNDINALYEKSREMELSRFKQNRVLWASIGLNPELKSAELESYTKWFDSVKTEQIGSLERYKELTKKGNKIQDICKESSFFK